MVSGPWRSARLFDHNVVRSVGRGGGMNEVEKLLGQKRDGMHAERLESG